MAPRRNVKYNNGSCFAVPLRTIGFGVGLVARNNGKGVAFGYFFGPMIRTPSEANVSDLHPSRAVLVGQFGDLGLVKGAWPILEPLPRWDPELWPFPPLARVDKSSGRAWLSTYDERSFVCREEREVDVGAAQNFVADGVIGYGAVEIWLTKLIGTSLLQG
jgi:Immunity protein 26